MQTLQYCLRKLAYGVPLLLGVTLISFVLMVYFGPDQTYNLLGRNPTAAQIAAIHHQLHYDDPFWLRYYDYLKQMLTFNFGYSDSTGEKVTSILARTIPISIKLGVPGFIIGHLVSLALGLFAAYHRGKWLDKLVIASSVVGMSISYLIIIIVMQLIFCSSYGLNWFPVYGWDVHSFSSYLYYVSVPTLCSVLVSIGYSTRFYRAILVEEMNKDHVRTALAFGHGPVRILIKHILKNALIPIITRIIFSIPFVLIGGSLLLESFFGIPGIGLTTYNAITTGDLPIIKAVITLVTLVFIVIVCVVDVIYKWVDPRISLK
ncbi:ABC transporter permease [Celerinatantimonas diazotrophica]|uniref:Peptide/nickel transport system permease protein n=1 Tax=Celerinatantimonas diazotrophica TaxID=412034 RepID=A0A4R1K4M4_9GAMM|nr:ABC transporter permease [Celerinatantimonas diazotrophica]TCK58877.1 peptide/nickel transport system permease protein [Celerinatantimonas diazotrophica]CAG9297509.1 Dipeptide transport system permease protein DppB [Celerinatantimonas diazotrophica]